MRLRCAVLDDYQGVSTTLADWSPVREQVEVVRFREHLPTEEAVALALADIDIVVTIRERVAFPASLLRKLPRLRLLVASGARNSVIDYAAAQDLGVTVCGTRSSTTPPVELTWALILALARNIAEESSAFRTGGSWQSTVGLDLHGRQLGLIGFGRIGSEVARIGKAFGMDVVAWSEHLTLDRAREAGARLATSKEELLSTSDIVSIHLVLGESTRGLLGRSELRLLKSTAMLINTSRAGIVDQQALLTALHEGWFAGAGIDVFDIEPLPLAHPLRSAPRLLATPHLGYVTEDNYRAYYSEAVEDIVAYLAGSPIRVLS